MKSGSIQLRYGFVRDKNPGSELHFDLHQNLKKELIVMMAVSIMHLFVEGSIRNFLPL